MNDGVCIECYTAQRKKFSINNFFSKSDQIRSFLRVWSNLLKKSLIENFIFLCIVAGNDPYIKLPLCRTLRGRGDKNLAFEPVLRVVDPFYATSLFLYLLKNSEKSGFFCVFRGYRKTLVT